MQNNTPTAKKHDMTRRDWLRTTTMIGAAATIAPRLQGAAPAAPAAAVADVRSDQVLDLGTRRELFVDRLLVERLENAVMKLHEPVSGGVAIRIDRPWEGALNQGTVVIQVNEEYLLYYRGMRANQTDEPGSVGCLATSADGITWTKPALSRHARSGRTDANIVSTGGWVWLDTRPGIPEDERIKAVGIHTMDGAKLTGFGNPPGSRWIDLWASADGRVFRRLPEERQPTFVSSLRNSFDGGNTMFWSEAEQLYVFYYRFMLGQAINEYGQTGLRAVARTTSPDLVNWSEPEPMTYGDAPFEQFYYNNTQAYFRAPHIYVALAARFMEGRSALNDTQADLIGLKSPRGGNYHQDCCDAVLMTTRPGSTQYDRTFMEALVRPGIGLGHWVSRTNFPLTGIFPHGPDKLMFYINRRYCQDTGYIERMEMRLDGFASIHAPHAGGSLLTKPMKISGDELVVNFSTSAAGSVRVELQELDGTPIPGFTLADCPEMFGDEIERVVHWTRRPPLYKVAGKPLRLKFVMHDADIYAIQFRSVG
jgi:hypothetical protein